VFSLIVTIISIALVTAIAAATIYYGGTAFTTAGADAEAARVINDSQQLSGAITLYKHANGTDVTDLSVLVSQNYLSMLPGGAWQVVEGGVARTDLNEDQCLLANKKLGVNSIPSCSDPAFTGVEVCCSAE
jgi:hypothetical protein